jgi:hypothetical protein
VSDKVRLDDVNLPLVFAYLHYRLQETVVSEDTVLSIRRDIVDDVNAPASTGSRVQTTE